MTPGGATDIYSPVIDALTELENIDTNEYTPAIILMTDRLQIQARVLQTLALNSKMLEWIFLFFLLCLERLPKLN